MSIFQSFLFAAVSLVASVIGAICGIGGGVIIKPVLDVFGWASVSAISFLSGCTVLSMSCYSVFKSIVSPEKSVEMKTGTALAVGAAFGGIIGKALFSFVRSLFENQNTVGAVQAFCLGVITIGTLIYTLCKSKIHTYNVTNIFACVAIGLVLGIMSSFLGIGGGPINLVVLYFFFSMATKVAASNSLYIILFSQAATFLSTIFTKSVPEFSVMTLVLMVSGGILGGIIGRAVNKKIEAATVDRLFICLMCAIICICGYNVWHYM